VDRRAFITLLGGAAAAAVGQEKQRSSVGRQTTSKASLPVEPPREPFRLSYRLRK
jgi:hypothetical protein